MSDQTLTKLVAAAPLAVGWLVIFLSPIYDRFIEWGAQREFKDSPYLEPGKAQMPVPLITQYTSWALDVAQAGLLVFGPLVGLIVALSGKANRSLGWIYFSFVFVGFVIFSCTAGIKHPAEYGGKKYGFRRDNKLWFGWTRVSILSIILYLGASVLAFFLA